MEIQSLGFVFLGVAFCCCLLVHPSQALAFTSVRLTGINVGLNSGAPTPQLALVAGRPVIVYSGPQGLGYLRANDDVGSTWNLASTSTTNVKVDDNPVKAQALSLAIVNSRPAIVYANSAKIKYIRATDTYGLTWGCPLTLLKAPMDVPSNLITTQGNPTVVLSGLAYLRAKDANGDAWPAQLPNPEWVYISYSSPTLTNGGFWPSAATVNGRPAIAFATSHLVSNGVSYTRALNANGLSVTPDGYTHWGPTIRVAATGMPKQIILKVVSGKPAIVYTLVVNGEVQIYYTYASDIDGNTWQPPRLVTRGTNLYPGVSFTVVRLKPTIVYADKTYGNIRLAIAREAQGLTWDFSVVVLRASLSSPFHVSLAEINGRAAITYLENDGDVMYAYEPGCVPCGSTYCSLLISVSWCQANCPTGTYGGTCTPTYCRCPGATSGSSPAPAPPPIEESQSLESSLASNEASSSCEIQTEDGQCEEPSEDGSVQSEESSAGEGETNSPLPCVPCTKLTNEQCYGVADEFWCSHNCLENGTAYGGGCQPYICFCPENEDPNPTWLA